MDIVSCRCPDCGGNLENAKLNSHIRCEFCGSTIYVSDNNTSHVVHSVKDPEMLGYSFEMGRIKAQRAESEAQRQRLLQEAEKQRARDRNRLLLKILLWVLFLPVMSVIYIVKSQNISREIKFFLVFAIVVVILSYILG